MALALLAGGHEIEALFEIVANQVIEGPNQVTFEVAVEAARQALVARLNQTAQVYALNKMEQGSQTFGSWYVKVMESGKRIAWDDYNLNVAVKNILVMNCESDKLRQKAIAENLDYEAVVRTGLAMENSAKKGKNMGPEEQIRSLEEKVRKLESGNGKPKPGPGKDKCKTCGRASGHPKGQTCFALNLTCHKCGRKGHLQGVCKSTGADAASRKNKPVKYVSNTDEEDEELEEVVRKIRKKYKSRKGKSKKKKKANQDTDSDSSSVGRILESGCPPLAS